ncbi:MAG: C25 family cysteine peptidase, partial [Promethearchaeota archaeon]
LPVLIFGLILFGSLTLEIFPSQFFTNKSNNTNNTSLNQTLSSGQFELVIIAPTGFDALGLGKLVNWKRLRGVNTTLVNIDFINSTISGSDLPEKIRNFLTAAYNEWNTTYVLLAGDVDYIPTRYIFLDDDHPDDLANGFDDNLIPCDLYYACLNGTWNADNDPFYGELVDDLNEMDWDPELIVGRLPISASNVSAVVDKIIQYEMYPILSGLNGSLLVSSVLTQSARQNLNASKYQYQIIDPLFTEVWWNLTRLYQMNTSITSPDNLTYTNALNLITSGNFSLINWVGNSNPYSLYKTVNGSDVLILNSTTIQNETFVNLPFMYLGFGLNTPLDYPSKGNYDPLTGDAIGEVLIRHSTGAIALIGNTRAVWYQIGDETGSELVLARNRYFWENFTTSGYLRPAISFYNSTERFDNTFGDPKDPLEWKILAAQVFLGDPETPMWVGQVNPLSVTAQAQVFEDQLFVARVTNQTGNPVPNASISILGIDGVIYRATTNSSGYVRLRAPGAIGNYTILAQHEDYDHGVLEGEVIDNSEPVIESVQLTPDPVFRLNETLIIQVNVTDVENTTAGRVEAALSYILIQLNFSGGFWVGNITVPKGGPVGNQSITITAFDIMNNHTTIKIDYVLVLSTPPEIVSIGLNSTLVYKNATIHTWTNITDPDNYPENLTVTFTLVGSWQNHTFQGIYLNGLFQVNMTLNNTWLGGEYQFKVFVVDDYPLNDTAMPTNVSVLGLSPEIIDIDLPDSVIAPNSFPVTVTMSDADANIAVVQVCALDPQNGWHNRTTTKIGDTYTTHINTLNQPQGNWTIYVVAVDLDQGMDNNYDSPEYILVIQEREDTFLIILGVAAVVGAAVLVVTWFERKQAIPDLD